MQRIFQLAFLLFACAATAARADSYAILPGDMLHISVWGDDKLDRNVRVLPDGAISFPLVGRIEAAGTSVDGLREQLTARISEFVPEPEVSVSVVDAMGSQVYVLGNVNSPGAFGLRAPLTVTRVLALAGGLNAFADTNDIRIIRGDGGRQRILKVDYDELLNGRDLSSNHLLSAGDTVLVP